MSATQVKINAIINVQSGSVYSKVNDKMFPIEAMSRKFVSIKGLNPDFPDSNVDFSLDEIIIPNSSLVLPTAYLKTDCERQKDFCIAYLTNRGYDARKLIEQTEKILKQSKF
jgi:hypothetical protein